MIVHYLKNAFKSFFRNKFIAFVNLFGISFTLLMMTLLFSFLVLEWGTDTPNQNKYLIVDIPQIEMKKVYIDTIYQIDSTKVGGDWKYDTLGFTTEKGDQFANSSANMGYSFIEKYLLGLETPVAETFYTWRNYDIFLSGGKINARVVYSDYQYWKLYPYHLLEGAFYNQSDEASGASNIVITDKFAKKYFGKEKALGGTVHINNRNFTVKGIVENPKGGDMDCFVSYVNLPDHLLNSENYMGGFQMSYLVKEKSDIPKLKEEITAIGDKVEPIDGYNDFIVYSMTFFETYAFQLLNGKFDEVDQTERRMWIRFSLFGLFLVLLPVLNLLNINISRILERKSEIGIRKSYGANSWHIFYQFLMENILLSLMAGIIAIVLAVIAIHFINSTELLEDALVLNPAVVLYGMLAAFIFGVLFGVLPAIRLSKMNIVESLKK